MVNLCNRSSTRGCCGVWYHVMASIGVCRQHFFLFHVHLDQGRVSPPAVRHAHVYASYDYILSIEIATRAADSFQRLYYKTYDSSTRVSDVPAFYRPSSAVSWNGKPFQGADGMRKLMEGMPVTKHDVQSFDCHPIPGEWAWSRSPGTISFDRCIF